MHGGRCTTQPVLQRNERAIFERMRPLLRWEGLRELMLFGFSDAASLEHKKELALSPYWQTQRLILQRLDELFDEMGEAARRRVAIVAQSLGCQVMSNYIWDAQQPRAYAGIWSAPLDDGVPADSPRDRFRRMRSLQLLMTTGCNIPVFVAGHSAIEPIDRRKLAAGFRWINQFDPDDVLGWPLAQLSAPYAALVEDHAVNASGDTLLGRIKSLTPYSHTQYWSTGKRARPHCRRAERNVGVGLKPDLQQIEALSFQRTQTRGSPCSSSTPTRSRR